MVLQAWETSGFNLSRAARALRIPRNTLRGKLRRMAVDDIP
ncbi:MAG: helix-turn-helix domain-containing protein [Polyangiaceae bacterium]|nr:helix-turn-helix domain-containing protein [Polyangiaceae bacterium]